MHNAVPTANGCSSMMETVLSEIRSTTCQSLKIKLMLKSHDQSVKQPFEIPSHAEYFIFVENPI